MKGEGAIQPAHSNVSFPTLPPVIPDYCQSSYPRAVSVIGFYSPDSCPVNICGSELGCVDMSWRRFLRSATDQASCLISNRVESVHDSPEDLGLTWD